MKKFIFFILASVTALAVVACSSLTSEQVQNYVSPQNVSLVTFSALLKSKPEAAPACEQLASDLRTLAEGGVLDLEVAYDKIAKSILATDMQGKKEVLVAIRALFNEYSYIFDTEDIDVSAYKVTIQQLAAGIEQALSIFYAGSPQVTVTK